MKIVMLDWVLTIVVISNKLTCMGMQPLVQIARSAGTKVTVHTCTNYASAITAM